MKVQKYKITQKLVESEEEREFEKLRECPDCGSEEIGFSYDQDEHFCRKCGLVLD